MLWYKSWLETRWRFVIGLVLLMLSVCGTVLAYPEVVKLLPLVPEVDLGGEIGRRVSEAMELARTYRGYVWSQWFRQNLMQTWTIFAVLLGTGGLLSQASGGPALFTLSLPVSRRRLLAVRAVTGLTELLALAAVPSLLLPLFSPLVGQSYGILDALIPSVCLFIAGSVFFSLAFLLSTVFSDVWRPLLIALVFAVLLAICEPFVRDFSIFRVMSAETYFFAGELPWLGLLACMAVSVAMLSAAARNMARQDF